MRPLDPMNANDASAAVGCGYCICNCYCSCLCTTMPDETVSDASFLLRAGTKDEGRFVISTY